MKTYSNAKKAAKEWVNRTQTEKQLYHFVRQILVPQHQLKRFYLNLCVNVKNYKGR